MDCHFPLRLSIVALTLALLAGCGEPDRVTYVDPNAGTRAAGTGGHPGEPIRTFGAATAERSKAIIHIRAVLAAARTVADAGAPAVTSALDVALREAVPVVEPKVHRANAAHARALRNGLTRLRDHPAAEQSAYAEQVRRLSTGALRRVEDLSIGADARKDPGYGAALLHHTLRRAARSYSAAVTAEGTIADPAAYLLAYGLVIDARTRQLDARAPGRATIASTLDSIARSSLPGPTPPARPRDPELVAGELRTLADDVARAAAIDPTYPEPGATTADRLRSLKRRVALATEEYERGDAAEALRLLHAAEREDLAAAADGLAAVSPPHLVEVEGGVTIEIPRAMNAGSDVTPLASELDATLDEAIQRVEDELELLDDA